MTDSKNSLDVLIDKYADKETEHPDSASKKKILVIDDDSSIRRGIQVSLSHKYEVITAKSGIEGLERIDRSIHCVVLDIKMRELDGFETYPLLKEKHPLIPIIFFTAFQTEHDLVSVINRFKPEGYIEKGSDIRILDNLISNACDKYRLAMEHEDYKVQLEENCQRLEEANKKYDDTNIALEILIDKIEDKVEKTKENIFSNINMQILPYLNKLEAHLKDDKACQLLEIIRNNIHEIVSPLAKTLTSDLCSLTPSELEVAALIKSGYRSKEIADILHLAVKTVEAHRMNIRKKLGLLNKKQNLRTYLLSIELEHVS